VQPTGLRALPGVPDDTGHPMFVMELLADRADFGCPICGVDLVRVCSDRRLYTCPRCGATDDRGSVAVLPLLMLFGAAIVGVVCLPMLHAVAAVFAAVAGIAP
jgi:hypothetical protein